MIQDFVIPLSDRDCPNDCFNDCALALFRESGAPRSISSTDRRFMHPIDDPGSCDGSLPSKSCSDDVQQHPSAQPGGNLLTSTEIKLCVGLNLPPTRFITLKTVLLSGGGRNAGAAAEVAGSDSGTATTQTAAKREGDSSRYGSNNNNNNAITPNMNSTEKTIRKYLIKAGWLSAGN